MKCGHPCRPPAILNSTLVNEGRDFLVMNVKLCWNHFSKIDVAALQMTFIQEDLNKFYRNREIFDVDFMKTNIWFESRVARPAELPVVHSDVVLQVQCLFIVYLKFEFNTLMFSSFAHFFFLFSVGRRWIGRAICVKGRKAFLCAEEQ